MFCQDYSTCESLLDLEGHFECPYGYKGFKYRLSKWSLAWRNLRDKINLSDRIIELKGYKKS